jgi:hypothetical protein
MFVLHLWIFLVSSVTLSSSKIRIQIIIRVFWVSREYIALTCVMKVHRVYFLVRGICKLGLDRLNWYEGKNENQNIGPWMPWINARWIQEHLSSPYVSDWVLNEPYYLSLKHPSDYWGPISFVVGSMTVILLRTLPIESVFVIGFQEQSKNELITASMGCIFYDLHYYYF